MERRRFLSVAAMAAGAAASGATGWRIGTERARADAAEAAGARSAADASDVLGSLEVLWSVTTEQPLAALTFDDGPDPEFTPRVLAALDRAGVAATFNMMGFNVDRYPDLAKEVSAAGHEIGNHTQTHLRASELDQTETRDQIRACNEALERIGVDPVRWFRPPRGELSGFEILAAEEAGLDVLMWSVLGSLSGNPSSTEVAARLIAKIGPGDIVALHDGIGRGTFSPGSALNKRLTDRRNAEIEALPEVLAEVAAGGIEFVTVTDLLAAGTPR